MKATNYPSSLTGGRWEVIRHLLPKRSKQGRKPIDRRLILGTILYVLRTGCPWRALPKASGRR